MMVKAPTKVLCVDDHVFVADGLQARLSMVKDLEFAGRLSTAEDVVDSVRRTGANVVLMDIEMPGKDPFEATEDLRRACPDARVIFLSAYVRDHYIDAAVNAGAWGYMSKSDDPEQIIESIRKVASGEFVFGSEVLGRCDVEKRPGARPVAGAKPQSKLQLLTPREQQILRMIGRGLGREEIAKTICRSAKTVDAHRASIMEKMGIHDRVELARFAIREGLVEA